MQDADLDALTQRIRTGDPSAFAELSVHLQRDLAVFIACSAADWAMVEAVVAASWSAGRQWLAAVTQTQTQAQPQGGLWVGRTDQDGGAAVAARLREHALQELRGRLAACDQQSIAAQDTLLHLVAQSGLESLPSSAHESPDVVQLIRDRLRAIPPTANSLLAKRYSERLSVVDISNAQARSAAEVASALTMARNAVDWQSGGGMFVDPGDRDFPTLVEQYLAGSLPFEARSRLAEGLLSDIGRTASFVRQVRIDLVLAAFSREPPADVVDPPSAALPSSRFTKRPAVPAGGAAPPAGRAGKSAPLAHARAAAPARIVIAASLLTVVAVVCAIALSRHAAPLPRQPTSLPTVDRTGGPPSAVPHAPPATSAGTEVARIAAGQAFTHRSGERVRLPPGAPLSAGEGLDTDADAGPTVLTLSGGRTITLGVNSVLTSIESGDGQSDLVILEHGHVQADGPDGSRGIAVRSGQSTAVGDGAAFTVTSIRSGMRVDVSRGTVRLLRNGPSVATILANQMAVVSDQGEMSLDSIGTFVAGIKLGGPATTVDGHRWKSQRHAQADGLTLVGGSPIAFPDVAAEDSGVKGLLGTGLGGGDVQISQALANGTYDVVAWVAGVPRAEAGALTIGGRPAIAEQGRLGASGWLKAGPQRVTVGNGRLEVRFQAGSQQGLAGIAVYAALPGMSDLPPTAFLDEPAGDTTLTAPASVTLTADAYAPTGAIHSVEFLVDATKVGEALAPPYQATWSCQVAGVHQVTARAVTTSALVATSAPVTVTVNQADAPKPALLLALAEGTPALTAPASVTLVATPEHVDGAITRIEFLGDGNRIGEVTEPPYRCTWSKIPAGEHTIVAVATGAHGLSSAARVITVLPPIHPPPVVAIDSPDDGSEVPESSHLSIRAKASAVEGKVVKVVFSVDGQPVGEATIPPFACTWMKATPGSHQLTAVAIDSSGAKASSEPVLVILGKYSGFLLVRGICLGGDGAEIDGGHWMSQTDAVANGLSLSAGKAVAEPMQPVPAVEPGLAQMLSSAYESSQGDLRLTQNLPDGTYQVAVWMAEGKTAYAHACDLELQGIRLAQQVGHLTKGAWAKYGPYLVKVRNQRLSIDLKAKGASAPRLMGMAIYAPPIYPRPLVEVLFDAISGGATPNTGLTAGMAPLAGLTTPWPQARTASPPGAGPGCIDLGKTPGVYGVVVPGVGAALRDLKSFTIALWLNCRDKRETWGGNRLLDWTTGSDGVDLAYHSDGSVQLGVNSWNDQSGIARSSAGKVPDNDAAPADNWRFIAVSYDSTAPSQQVRYYVGSPSEVATLDKAVDSNHGPVGAGTTVDLGIGNMPPVIRNTGQDRMFRGLLDQVRIWGSSQDASGALTPEQIIAVQGTSTAPIRMPAAGGPAVVEAPAPAGMMHALIDDFERDAPGWAYVGGWEFPGAKGASALDAGVGHSGTHSYRLDYDFTGGGAYVGVWKSLETFKATDVKEFHFWAKTSGITALGVRLLDGSDQLHQSSVRLLKTNDWQEVVINVAEASSGEHWGGPNDGQWHPPAKGFGLNVGRNKDLPADQQHDTIWFDDVSALIVAPKP